mgnify:CR=1 FL=1
MITNLLDAVKNYLPSNLTGQLAGQLNESESGVSKALTAAVPAVLAGFVNRAESGDADGLLRDAREADNSNILGNIGGLLSGGGNAVGGGLDRLLGMFGGGGVGNGLVSMLSNFAGIRSGSIQSILGMLAPLGLGLLGKQAREQNLNAQGLTSYLSGQKNSILGALPAGLSLGSLFGGLTGGFDRTTSASTTTATTTHSRVSSTVHDHDTHNTRRGGGLLPWLALAAGILALLWFLSRGCNRPDEDVAPATTDTVTRVAPAGVDTATMPTATVTATRESMKVKLAGGTELDAYRGGVEDQLVACLNDADCTAGKDRWFDFDNINFEVGSARLTSESQQQVNNLAAILKAYPNAKIKIGGYTDKTGNEPANQKLSQDRANTVMNAIKTAGANAGQLTGAEGYGSQFATVAASASDEERRKDRRIAVQLAAK